MSYGFVAGSLVVNASAPYSVTFNITTDDPLIDLSTAVSAVIDAQHASGVVNPWSCTLSGLSSTSVTITHVLANGDIPDVEDIVLQARVALLSGEVICKAVRIRIDPRFNA
jgi:hypothetical protein